MTAEHDEKAKEVAKTSAQSEESQMISIIERVALDPNVDVGKLERMLDMQERIFNKNAEMAFNKAMVRTERKMTPVVKDAINDHTKSTYARLETVDRQIRPIYTEEGFSLSFGTDDSPLQDCIRITCTLAHEDGHVRHYKADIPSDLYGAGGKQTKTKTHAFGSTISYGQRYLLKMIFNVAMANEDDDGNAAGPNTDKKISGFQAGILRNGLEQCDEEVKERFAIRYTDPSNVPRSQYDGVCAYIRRCVDNGGHAPDGIEEKETGE